MKIRKANQTDAVSIAQVHVDSWKSAYKDIIPDEYLKSLTYESRTKLWENNLEKQQVYVAENNNGKIIGFSVGGKERTGNYAGYSGEIYAIYIVEEYHGNGIGKMLMLPVMEELKQMGIHSMIVLVLEDNPARYFYEFLGARRIGTLKVKIAGKELNELVYGWDDLNKKLM
ncbi:GNAT family N-acetyltransferase [Virgibacillus profundi]|uniref:GNAT family N-acetyltransferase n=1 Tax=Virgibacillus profundi TaxID=2024555 RepID=A0A2A2IE86_9BACI|nr:GNAT family N-acetyltransferase [Virgibacillus profundi]PAV29678.1 GNAT family N-acetyltransferase [Virgibacillus profundi]PXY53850.1 N-acetyltransferase [Virgibacillus profundi]